MHHSKRFLNSICAGLLAGISFSAADLVDIESILQQRHGALGKPSAAEVSSIIESAARNVQAGGILLLPRSVPVGEVDLTGIANDVTLRFGYGGTLHFGQDHSGLRLEHARLNVSGLAKGARETGTRAGLENAYFLDLEGVVDAQADNSVWIYNNIGASTWNITGSWKGNDVLYLQMLHEHGNGKTPKVAVVNADATGSKIYGIVETDYCASSPSVTIINSKGLFYGIGDSERPSSKEGLYQIRNSNDITLVGQRLFHSHGGSAGTCGGIHPNGLLIDGGSGNKLVMYVDINDNENWSLKAEDTDNLQIWGGFFEDAALISGNNPLLAFHTPDGFGGKPKTQWGGPGDIKTDVILDYKGKKVDRTHSFSSAPDLSGFELPRPPRIATYDFLSGIGRQSGAPLKKVSATWGSKALAMGLDATGTHSASTILQRLIDEDGFVEVPAGDFRITEALKIKPGTVLAGAGPGSTRLFADGISSILEDATSATGLAKGGAAGASGEVQAVTKVMDVQLDGNGTTEVGWKKDGYTSTTNTTVEFKNFTFAGVFVGDWEARNNPAGMRQGDGFDQVRWLNCTFVNTGKYGMFTNREQVDKQLWYNCLFEGQKVAGISYMRTHMYEASSIVHCTFKDIDGPGVQFGGNLITGLGQGGGPAQLHNCLFVECGNENQAAVEWGWMRMGVVLNTKIVIKNKAWKYGFRGTGQMMQDVEVDVDMSKAKPGALAFAIRHPRQIGGNRVTGNILVGLKSQGPLGFINDVASYKSLLGEDWKMPGSYERYDWGWTHLLSDCELKGGEQNYDYVMVATDEAGSIKKQVAFSGEAPSVGLAEAAFAPTRDSDSRSFTLHDAQGRRVMTLQGSLSTVLSGKKDWKVEPGLYFLKTEGMQPMRLVL